MILFHAVNCHGGVVGEEGCDCYLSEINSSEVDRLKARIRLLEAELAAAKEAMPRARFLGEEIKPSAGVRGYTR